MRRPVSPADGEAPGRIGRLLAAVPTETLTPGFRDAVMRRVSAQRSVAGEWIVAAVLAAPSLIYIGTVFVNHGGDLVAALGDVALAAQGAEDLSQAFFVDGLVILAVAMCGLASIVAAHALLSGGVDARRPLPR